MDEYGQCTFDMQQCSTTNALTPECELSDACVPSEIWWNVGVEKATNISNQLYSQTPNGVIFNDGVALSGLVAPFTYNNANMGIWMHQLWLYPDPSQKMHVFEIESDKLKQATTFIWAPDETCADDQMLDIVACEYKYKPEQEDYIVFNVLSNDGQCDMSDMNIDILEPYINKVIWNFNECETLQLTNIGFHGMIVAPTTHILTGNGHINGHVFANSFNGPMQINWYPFQCIDIPPPPENCTDYCNPNCLNYERRCNIFGCASNFNVFVFSDYSGTSDVEGRLAAGGDIYLGKGFSVGNKLFNTVDTSNIDIDYWNNICLRRYGQWEPCEMCDGCGQSVLVAGGTIDPSYTEGRVYFGHWLSPDMSGQNTSQHERPEYGTVTTYKASLLDNMTCPDLSGKIGDTFFNVFTEVSATSEHICGMAPTAIVDDGTGGFIRVALYGDSELEVININGTALLNAHTFSITNMNKDATIIFNVFGTVSGLTSIDLDSLKDHAHKVLWNFCEATKLNISNVAVHGSILAPFADVHGGEGVIWGQLQRVLMDPYRVIGFHLLDA